MKRRSKQIVYGTSYIVFLLIILTVVYAIWLKPVPTCFDGILNQDEQGVDCGGICQKSCSLLSLRPVEIVSVDSVVVNNMNIAVVEIRNPNVEYGVGNFEYSLSVPNRFGEVMLLNDETFIYPGEIRYRVLIDVPIETLGGEIDSLPYKFSTSTLNWLRLDSFSKPKSQIRDVKTSFDTERNLLFIEGILKNENNFKISEAVLSGAIYDDDNLLIGASRTLIKDLEPVGERFFQIVVSVNANFDQSKVVAPKLRVEMMR